MFKFNINVSLMINIFYFINYYNYFKQWILINKSIFINVAILNNTVLMDVLKNPFLIGSYKKSYPSHYECYWIQNSNFIIIFIIIKYSK